MARTTAALEYLHLFVGIVVRRVFVDHTIGRTDPSHPDSEVHP
jgi:hypothetical protein